MIFHFLVRKTIKFLKVNIEVEGAVEGEDSFIEVFNEEVPGESM